MTVWMHKGGDILLRYDYLYCYENSIYAEGSYLMVDGDGKIHRQPQSFFKKHCVYIGRF